MSETQLDVIIIGAGPIGLACGIEAARRGFTHLIIEKGCLVDAVFRYPTSMTFFSTADKLEIGDVPFISHGAKPTRSEALEYYRRVCAARGLHVRTYEKVVDVEGAKNDFTVRTREGAYRCRYLIAATGYFDHPNLMGVPGEDLPKVRHYYDEPHPYAGQKVLIVGGGNSAVDAALETFRCRAEVTLVVQKKALEDNVKYWVRPDIENRIQEGAVKAYFRSTVEAIREKDVDIRTPRGLVTLENAFVLAMTGYRPDFAFLKKIGIHVPDDGPRIPAHDAETQETDVKGLFLAGVVCGGLDTSRWYIENARVHAAGIFDHLEREREGLSR
jgi:thioredoxin reductase (NADPH)